MSEIAIFELKNQYSILDIAVENPLFTMRWESKSSKIPLPQNRYNQKKTYVQVLKRKSSMLKQYFIYFFIIMANSIYFTTINIYDVSSKDLNNSNYKYRLEQSESHIEESKIKSIHSQINQDQNTESIALKQLLDQINTMKKRRLDQLNKTLTNLEKLIRIQDEENKLLYDYQMLKKDELHNKNKDIQKLDNKISEISEKIILNKKKLETEQENKQDILNEINKIQNEINILKTASLPIQQKIQWIDYLNKQMDTLLELIANM